MRDGRLLELPAERREVEKRRALEEEAGYEAFERRRARVFWQCVALSFAGVPLYAWSWHLTGDSARVAAAGALVISYAVPFFRWVVYLVSESEEFRR